MSTYNIIKVNATKSTNDKVKMLIKSKKINNKDVICAKYQYKGRGQRSNRWYSSYGNNLLCSLYLELPKNYNSPIFALNYAVTLSALDTIRFFNKKKSLIKWPNDILSEDNKISGILIENNFKNNNLFSSIIGVGINVNQTKFKNLKNVTSLKKIVDTDIDVNCVLDQLLKNYHNYFERLNDINYLSKKFNQNLYGKSNCRFLLNKKVFKGKVEKVLDNGNLLARIDTSIPEEFRSSEIKIIY